MSAARTRLAARAAAAAYPAALLREIAQATVPAYRPGDTLDDAQIEHVARAVETLVEAGYTADRARERIAHHQRAGCARWRDVFWAEALHAASQRCTRTPAASA